MAAVLEVSGLHFAYGKAPVLNGIDLQLPRGKLVALLGANGSGKSTLVKCLTGVLRPASGSVQLEGNNLLGLPLRRRASLVAYVPQALGAEETSLTVHETIAQGVRQHSLRPDRDEVAQRTIAAMAEVGLTKYAFEPINRLSGGERQRVYIARALAMDTDYILLDEPVSALDLRYQRQVMGLLIDLARRGRGVLTVIHDLNLAACYADSVALLSAGRVAAAGAPRQTLTAPLLSRIYDTEIEVAELAGRVVVLSRPPDQAPATNRGCSRR